MRASWLGALFLCACGSDSVVAVPDAQADVAREAAEADASVEADAPAEMFPAFPFDLPTAVSLGGPTLKNPKIVPIVFADEDSMRVTKLTDFLGKLAGSSYWTETTKEYGVDSLTIAPLVMLAENAPVTTTPQGIESWLASAIMTSKLAAPDVNTIYSLYYPQTTTINAFGGKNCTGFGGYHGQTTVMSSAVVFTVVAGCASYGARLAPGETVQGIDFTTGLTAHELVEAVTDPLVASQPAYRDVDAAHVAWRLFLYGAEIGDTCEPQPNAFFTELAIGYVVQRMWSNQARNAGRDPCVPHEATPFFLAWPVQQGFGPLIKLGATGVIAMKLASDSPTNGPWAVKAIDYTSERGGAAQLALSLDKTSGKNGDMLSLTVKVLLADPSGYEGFLLESQLGSVKHRTAGVVHQ